MATIEVHDGQGRVQFVALSRDHPLLFGTSAACDVVLEGEGIRPVHGRIRWKSKRFKIEASPDAQFVLINGHRMTTGSVRQGDEITVGPCRMFLLKVDDDSESESGSKSQADEGRTKVLPSPFAGMTGTVHPQHRSHDRKRTGPGGETLLERDDWLGSLKRSRSADRGASETIPLVGADDDRRGRKVAARLGPGPLIQAVRAGIKRLLSASESKRRAGKKSPRLPW